MVTLACLVAVILVAVAWLAYGAAPASATTYVWQGGSPECVGDRVSFEDVLNWLPLSLSGPGSGDTCLALASATPMTISSDAEVGAINGFQSILVESDGSLKINGSTGDSDIGMLTLNGKLTNQGKLTIALCNAYADIDNSGTLSVSSFGGILCAGGRILNSGTIELAGACNITGPSIITTDPVVENTSGATIKKTSGVLSMISASVWNKGTIVATSGSLSLAGGDSGKRATGSFQGDGGTLLIDNDYILDSGAQVLGGVEVTSLGTLTVLPGVSVPFKGDNQTWGVLAGPGKIAVDAAGVLRLNSGASLSGVTVENSGRLAVSGDRWSVSVSLESGANITNSGTIDFTGDVSMTMDDWSPGTVRPTITSTGTIKKTGGTDTSELTVPLRNDGTASSTSGTLILLGGDADDAGSKGSFAGTAPAVLQIAGAFKLASGAKLLGGVLLGSRWGRENTVTIVSGATVPASGVNTIADATLAGPGTLQIPVGATFVADCGGKPILSGLAVDNKGVLAVKASSTNAGYVWVINSTTITNDGTLEFRGDGSMLTWSDVTSSLTNSGTLRKVSGDGTSELEVPMAGCSGPVTALNGTLSLTGASTAPVTSSFQGDGGTVNIAGAFKLASGAKLLGGVVLGHTWWPNTVTIVSGATVPASGVNTIDSATLAGPGTLQIPTGATFVADCGWRPTLSGLAVDNQGVLAVKASNSNDGYVTVINSTTITNSGTLEFRGDASMLTLGDVIPSLTNSGTLRKVSGDGTSELEVPMAGGSGPVTALNGTLSLTGASTAPVTSSFQGDGGTVNIAGTFKLASGAKLLGGVLLGHPVWPNTVTIVSGATVPASGVNTIADATLAGPGTLQIPVGATFVADCGWRPALSGLAVDNQGVLAVKASSANNGYVKVMSSTTISNSGTLEFRGDGSMLTLGDVTSSLTNSGTVQKVAGTGTSEMAVPLIGSGLVKSTKATLRLTGGSPVSTTGSFGGAAGTVSLAPSSQRLKLGDGAKLLGGVVVDAPSQTILVTAGATASATGTNTFKNGTLAGPGTLQVPAGATFVADCEGAPILSGLAVDNQGVLAVKASSANNGYVTVVNSTTISNSGTLEFRGDASMLTLSDVTSSLTNSGTLQKVTGTGTSELQVALQNDSLVSGQTGTLKLSGGLGNFDSGTGTLTGGSWEALGPGILQLSGANVSINASDLALSGAGAKITAATDGDSLAALATNADTGALTLEGGASLGIPRALANAGSVTIGENSTLTVAGPYTQTAGVTDLGAGTAALVSTGASAGVTATGGVVSGNGSMTPALTNSAEVSPDGVLTAGGYVQSTGGKLTIDVASTTVGSGYDRMAAGAGPVALSGALDIQTAPGYTPALGDTFSIITGASVTGTFNGVTGAALAPGVVYSVVYGPTSVLLRVTDGSGAPGISSLNPASGYIGQTVTITGTGFHTVQGTGGVSFGVTAATVSSWSDTSIVVAVPAGLGLGQTSITVVTAGGVSPPASFTVLAAPLPKPVLTKLSPTQGRIGVTVTLTGTNFGAKRRTSVVKFGTKAVTAYVSWSTTKIKVKVPKGTAKGRVKVTVKTAAGTSAARSFKRL